MKRDDQLKWFCHHLLSEERELEQSVAKGVEIPFWDANACRELLGEAIWSRIYTIKILASGVAALSYEAYLETRVWKRVSAFVKERDGSCVRCGDTDNLIVHHKTYAMFGREWDFLIQGPPEWSRRPFETLETRCDLCHAVAHADLAWNRRDRRP